MMSGRPYDLSESVKKQAWERQGGKCAICGRSMEWSEDHAHHVIPNQSGDPCNPNHDWLRSAENCVYRCDLCHSAAHNDNTQTGAVAPPGYFKCSQNTNDAGVRAHRSWASELVKKASELFASIRTKVLQQLSDFCQKMQNQTDSEENLHKMLLDLFNNSFAGFVTNKLYNSDPPQLAIWGNVDSTLSSMRGVIQRKDIRSAANLMPTITAQYFSAQTRFRKWYNGIESAGTHMQVAIWVTAV